VRARDWATLEKGAFVTESYTTKLHTLGPSLRL
jgi:hypothetical protein